MSRETSQWLNTMTLQGFESVRGPAWHNNPAHQGDQPNHYPLAIPVADVHHRLFHWAPAEAEVTATYLTVDGVTTVSDPTRKALVRPAGAFGADDAGAVLGIFKQGYQVHDYGQWLVSHVETIVDADLQIGSAGLLKGGAVAWVQIELAETLGNEHGIDFRPFMTAATSLDGSLATTYLTGCQVVVCDNTLSAALGDKSASRVKIRHSSRSLNRVGEVRGALGIVYSLADDFQAELDEMVATTVTDKQWSKFLDAHAPTKDEKGEAKTGRALTLATREREDLSQLWNSDNRVQPWRGTAWGVVQAVNTYTHHIAPVRGMDRSERNAMRVIEGGHDKLDQGTLATLRRVLA